jgi:transcriptional regulator with XRE-family HTH domain
MTESQRRKLIAARIKEARLGAGLSQGQVALLMKLHRPSVTEIEADNRQVSADEIRRLANIFDVSTSYLLGESPDTVAVDDPKIQLAARELQKLAPEALDKLLHALAMFRDDGKPKDETDK